ncbi:hypothetical protein EQP49_09725 [Yersinia sp. 2105 StPb PI]|nr:hypothetical protein CBW53_08775 [Yersinia frederiksenii]RXA96378.1 hypothetical protein EQP49_09725 [Yersinia sp. 2105 StPb PI]
MINFFIRFTCPSSRKKTSSYRHLSLTLLSLKTASIAVRSLTGYRHDKLPPTRPCLFFCHFIVVTVRGAKTQRGYIRHALI